MKALLFLFTCTALTVSAQTTIISHKSHSGTAATFAFADPGNFGAIEVMTPFKVLQKISDTSVTITTSYRNDNSSRVDTIYNHPIFSDPNISDDSLRLYLPDDVMYLNFKSAPVPVQSDSVPASAQPGKKISGGKSHSKAAPEKKNNLFWLWIIGGGTFTGLLIILRRDTAKRTFVSINAQRS